MRLITWNVARRIARLPDQAAALASREPDVVALQEVTARGHGLWRRELPDGTVMSFARDSQGRLREERGTEWDDGELGVVPRLAELGFADAIRALHGYERPERSWTFPGDKGGWRLDHAFVSAEIELQASGYHHDWRLAGLSDHSALEVDLSLRAGSPPAAR